MDTKCPRSFEAFEKQLDKMVAADIDYQEHNENENDSDEDDE